MQYDNLIMTMVSDTKTDSMNWNNRDIEQLSGKTV